MFSTSTRRFVVLSLGGLIAIGGFAAPAAAECDPKYNPCPINPGGDAPDPGDHYPDSTFDEHFLESTFDVPFPESTFDENFPDHRAGIPVPNITR